MMHLFTNVYLNLRKKQVVCKFALFFTNTKPLSAPKAELDAEETFVPHINQASINILAQRDDLTQRAPVEERLYNIAVEKKKPQPEIPSRSPQLTQTSKKHLRSKLSKELETCFTESIKPGSDFIDYAQLGIALKKLGLFRASDRRTEDEARMQEILWKAMDPTESGVTDCHTFKSVLLPVLYPESVSQHDDEVSQKSFASNNYSNLLIDCTNY